MRIIIPKNRLSSGTSRFYSTPCRLPLAPLPSTTLPHGCESSTPETGLGRINALASGYLQPESLFITRLRYHGHMQLFQRITIDPEMMSGKPCIRGMRVTVGVI